MRIMVCYDKSEAAQAALELSIQRAKVFNAKVYLVTSLFGGEKATAEENQNAENQLNIGKSRLEKEGVDFEARLLIRGLTPGEDIVKFADENEIDEIIIGVSKTSKVGKLLFGSTAQYVILEANCPVVTVK